MHKLIYAAAVTAAISTPASAATTIPAEITRVIDGDTVEATLHPMPDSTRKARLRLHGIDAPESWRPKCAAERVAGLRAKDALRRLVEGRHVTVTIYKRGKYGRWIATIHLPDGSTAGQRLLDAGLADRYGRKRRWCS